MLPSWQILSVLQRASMHAVICSNAECTNQVPTILLDMYTAAKQDLHIDLIPLLENEFLPKSVQGLRVLHFKQTRSIPPVATSVWFFPRSRRFARQTATPIPQQVLHLAIKPSLLCRFTLKLPTGSILSHPLHLFSSIGSCDSRACWFNLPSCWLACAWQTLHLFSKPALPYQADERRTSQPLHFL